MWGLDLLLSVWVGERGSRGRKTLTIPSHRWALVVEVLGADLAHHPGVHLLQ